MRIRAVVEVEIFCSNCSRHKTETITFLSRSEDDPAKETKWEVKCRRCHKAIGRVILELRSNRSVDLDFRSYFLNKVEGNTQTAQAFLYDDS